jgi:hypothetical protein
MVGFVPPVRCNESRDQIGYLPDTHLVRQWPQSPPEHLRKPEDVMRAARNVARSPWAGGVMAQDQLDRTGKIDQITIEVRK